MKRRALSLALLSAVLLLPWPSLAARKLDTAAIEKLTGLKGSLNAEENVFKVAAPRTDVKVAVDGWTMPPFMGLTSWAAFEPGKTKPAMVMGDFVLFQDEVNPVMSAALDSGLKVTALHNHFFYDEPRVFFMHVEGEGKESDLAAAVGRMLETVRSVRSSAGATAAGFGTRVSGASAISPEPIETIFGQKGQAKDGMLKIVIGRATKMKCDCEAGKEMGVNTWAAFAGTDSAAVVDGDIAMTEAELQPVLKALRAARINVVAIHNHMVEETPKIEFLHYWGVGPATTLARGVKSALDTQGRR